MVQNETMISANKPTFQNIDKPKSACRGGKQALPGRAGDGTYQMGFRTILRSEYTIDFLRPNTPL